MMILPNKAECYINKDDFGSFRVFLPTTGIVQAEADEFFLFNGECKHNSSSPAIKVEAGSVYDGYFQCDNNFRVYVGGGNVPTA